MTARKRIDTILLPGDKRHGLNGYTTYHCHCAICREAVRLYFEERRRRDNPSWTIRCWAKRHNLPVGDRGHVPASIVNAYVKAQREAA